MVYSVIRVNKKFYLQTLLEECKYIIKKKETGNLNNYDLNLSTSDESDNESDNKFDKESDNESDD